MTVFTLKKSKRLKELSTDYLSARGRGVVITTPRPLSCHREYRRACSSCFDDKANAVDLEQFHTHLQPDYFTGETTMDVQIILIGIPAFVVIAILIYLITAFAMREKTFEEVIAEQKRRQEEERERAKQGKKVEKEQYKKKYRKGKADKGKEKAAQVCGPEFKEPVMVEPEVTEHKMVNLEIDPEIIEPSDAVVLGGKSKVKPSRKSKPILVNKNEVTPVTEKATELPHKPITPRDEIELKKLHEKEVVPAVHVSTMQIETHQKKENKIVHQTENKQEVTETIKEVKEIKVQRVKAPRMESMIIQQNAPQEEGEKKISKIKNSSGEYINAHQIPVSSAT